MDRLTRWASLEALRNFYFGCPDDKTWRRHKKWYLLAWRNMKNLERILFSVPYMHHAPVQ